MACRLLRQKRATKITLIRKLSDITKIKHEMYVFVPRGAKVVIVG